MPFKLTIQDFRACDHERTRNISDAQKGLLKTTRRKFNDELKPELISSLGKQFTNFIRNHSPYSPYVNMIWSRRGFYWDHIWLGMAHVRYDDPRKGIQLQFGIGKDSVFCLGIWIEHRSPQRVRREISRNFLNPEILRLLQSLDDTFYLKEYTITGDTIREPQRANEVNEKDLKEWVTCIKNRERNFDISRKLSMTEAIDMGTAIVEHIASTFKELLPLYNFLAETR